MYCFCFSKVKFVFISKGKKYTLCYYALSNLLCFSFFILSMYVSSAGFPVQSMPQLSMSILDPGTNAVVCPVKTSPSITVRVT